MCNYICVNKDITISHRNMFSVKLGAIKMYSEFVLPSDPIWQNCRHYLINLADIISGKTVQDNHIITINQGREVIYLGLYLAACLDLAMTVYNWETVHDKPNSTGILWKKMGQP